MKSKLASLFILLLLILYFGCQSKQKSLSESQKQAAIDSAKAIATQVLAYSDKLDFKTVFQFYSDDSDARYVESGQLYPSLQAVKDNYNQIAPTIASLHNIVDDWSGVAVLNNNAVLLTLPLHFTIQAKGRDEYKGQYVWSIVVQKRHGRWMIIQSHESWLNAEEFIAAITPVTNSK